MDPITKTYVSSGLVAFALFEFWAAMNVFGTTGKPSPNARLFIRLHRILGYVFLFYFVWISWVCLDLMERLADAGRELDARAAIHGSLATILFLALLLKISFIRMYRKYRPYVPLLGIVVAVGTLALWGIAGLWFLFIV